MSDLSSTGGIETWLKKAERRLRSIEGVAAKGRIPRTCTSSVRPNPAKIQPGVRIFELDTNRSIFVNASQTGFVNSTGSAV